MPFYEYRCESCGHELEALQKISDPPLTDCPACGQATLKKKISAAGFRLKGGGWYETDFKNANRKNLHDSGEKPADAAKASEKKAGGEKKDAAKTADAKPAAASPAASG
ncbi:FmdB family zinc ribbon protein [Thiococcus pfennigii]|uniref:FmdB family zinc ribbon protein n=1 Tax=Thiococcus pfennigii TaxID=1057 RepID=UPI001904989C|nr:zinc ribbon domain-containing protein [Thiococcus pfennigii]MBK1731496.1 FmdB family transcriptional regulator [Thiococcus pfennigii]